MPARLRLTLLLICLTLPGAVQADDRLVRLAVPQVLVDSGLMKYMLPRFSLKTQVRVRIVAPGDPAEAEFGAKGTPVFTGAGATWHLAVLVPDHPGTKKFADWIVSKVGHAAITGYKPGGKQAFTLPQARAENTAPVTFEGDAAKGARLARAMCGRCHVSVANDPLRGIGSTPSFFVLRALPDWHERFQTFYVRNPHPSFTQVEGVTPPFSDQLPPPVSPLVMSVDDLDAIVAYVSGLKAADLGAPIRHQ